MNKILENSKKIKLLSILLLLSVLIFSCVKTNTYYTYTERIKNNLYFKHFIFNKTNITPKGSFIKNDTIYIESVYHKNKTFKLKGFLDENSFHYLFDSKTEKEKVNNPFYLKDDAEQNYFKDNEFIYIYKDDILNNLDGGISFIVAGSSSDYEVLGGSYLRVGEKIYCKGIYINGTDISTFKTVKILIPNSEWEKTIARDKNNFYLEEKK